MSDFVEESSAVVEFFSAFGRNERTNSRDIWTQSGATSVFTYQETQCSKPQHIGVQTELICRSFDIDDKIIEAWLKKIYPIMETELLEGMTQVFISNSPSNNDNISVVPYQKLIHDSASIDGHLIGVAAWLSIRINNVPTLVLSSSSSNHHGWCEHVDQTILLFVPTRVQENIIFTLLQTIPVNACVQHLSTNPFNKNVFAGVTVSSTLYLWEYISTGKLEQVQELFCETLHEKSIIGIGWLSMNQLLTCNSEGYIDVWKIAKQVVLHKTFYINSNARLSAILVMTPFSFIVGSENGHIFSCSNFYSNENMVDPKISEMEKHTFEVIHLFKTCLGSTEVILSGDISGELFFHDSRNSEDGPVFVMKMSLPFNCSIACSIKNEYIFSPCSSERVEIFRGCNGNPTFIRSSLCEKECLIQLSDNDSWLITAANDGTFQIFALNQT